jgi:hypothetical protein
MEPVFTESQKFNKWWHYLLSGLPLFIAFCTYLGFLMDAVPLKEGQKKAPAMMALIITLLIGILFFLWFFLLKLKTTINSDGIAVKFSGLPFCKRNIKWEEIQSISVVTYSPLSDYGGWGVRYSTTGNGWCYNVSGKEGIKIIYKNGKSFLIGTRQKEEAEKIINLYFKN